MKLSIVLSTHFCSLLLAAKTESELKVFGLLAITGGVVVAKTSVMLVPLPPVWVAGLLPLTARVTVRLLPEILVTCTCSASIKRTSLMLMLATDQTKTLVALRLRSKTLAPLLWATAVVPLKPRVTVRLLPPPLAVTLICSLSIEITSFTAMLALEATLNEVALLVIAALRVVTAFRFRPRTLARRPWAAAVVPLKPRVTVRVLVLLEMTLICSLSIKSTSFAAMLDRK